MYFAGNFLLEVKKINENRSNIAYIKYRIAAATIFSVKKCPTVPSLLGFACMRTGNVHKSVATPSVF